MPLHALKRTTCGLQGEFLLGDPMEEVRENPGRPLSSATSGSPVASFSLQISQGFLFQHDFFEGQRHLFPTIC